MAILPKCLIDSFQRIIQENSQAILIKRETKWSEAVKVGTGIIPRDNPDFSSVSSRRNVKSVEIERENN